MKLIEKKFLKAWIEDTYGIVTHPKKLAGEVDLNYYLKGEEGEEFILKIAPLHTKQEDLDMQNSLLIHLEKAAPEMQLPRVRHNLQGEPLSQISLSSGEQRWVRLLTWVPGSLLAGFKPHSPGLMRSLGHMCAKFVNALGEFDHQGAHRWFKWDSLQASWTQEDFHFIQEEKRKKAGYFLHLFQEKVLPIQTRLPKQIIHNDANDYNVLIDPETEEVRALIDFGDAIYTARICELAHAIAYAAMGKADPIGTAVEIVKGFHTLGPIGEEELEALFPLICARLLISVTCSARNQHEHPDNEYLLISQKPAWDLLDKFYELSPDYVYYRFRAACGMEACPKHDEFVRWASQQAFSPMFEPKLLEQARHILDFGVASQELGNNDSFDKTDTFDQQVRKTLDSHQALLGIGKYAEIRPIYTTDAYEVHKNEGPSWRTLHIGLDVFLPAGTPIEAPLQGIVHSFKNNAYERDYGPTIILQHDPQPGIRFYTLYGHLTTDSLEGLEVGQKIEQGKSFAKIGDIKENGQWPPHLHVQIILDMLGKEGDFPGVVFPDEAKTWLSICPDPQLLTGPLYESTPERQSNDLLSVRKRILGKNLSLSYQQPLHITRGYMQYLYDTSGRRYLDTANNVPHVGHQHPRVVRAAQKQLAVLNTNTRYLHENIVAFAEELTATFPDELAVAFFVNSGSEANELALRMARTYTGRKDMMVLDIGYHGNTQACVEISSYKFDRKGGTGAAPFIHKGLMPDGYRGKYRYPDTEIGAKYAHDLTQQLDSLQAEGTQIAGFIHESIMSCGGQIVLPQGYLKDIYPAIRKAGGVCIADEVQVGVGRVGDTFWGFELQGVVPDIVTIGKPIGNGHPLGAVVCRKEIADAFANGMEYFNTFGGNPVSCAIGREVLAIVQDEGLQEKARQTGNLLQEGLWELQKKYPIIGDVRGHGLFLGFEMVLDQETREPAGEACGRLANRMRNQGILMSTDGPHHNVIKIKPPLCFGKSHAEFLLESLDKTLQEYAFQVG